jgi:hypothetical protein
MDGEDVSVRRWLQSASALYDEITFKAPNDLYNYKAPDPWIAFMLGGVSFDFNARHGCTFETSRDV